MRLRVEELAARAEVSVDTVRFYQKQRLLPPPAREGRVAWYGADHLERLARIRGLQRRGFTLAVIRRLLAGELDAPDESLAAAVAAADADEERLLSLDQLAQRAGVPVALLEAVAREGLLVPRRFDGQPRFTDGDVAIVAAGLRLLETGLPLPELMVLAREHHVRTREVAEEAVRLFDAHIRQPLRGVGVAPEEAAERLVEAFRVLVPAVTEIVGHHFRRVLLQVAQEHLEKVGDPEEIAAARAEAERTVGRWPA